MVVTTSNIKKLKEYESTINIIDCLIDDIDKDIITKSFNFSIEYIMNFMFITFEDVRGLIKSYNKGELESLKIGLFKLRLKLTKIIINYRRV